MDKLDPANLQSWSPYAVMTLVVIAAGLLGSGLTWFATKGMVGYGKWLEIRAKAKAIARKEKEEEDALRATQDKQKKLIDKFIEGKLSAEGYRALLLLYDQRLQDLETKDR